MDERVTNIVIGGEAGQGLVTVGQLLSRSLVRGGYFIVVTQTYESRIRGGHNTFAIRVSSREVLAPQEGIDLLVALSAETVELHRGEMTSRGLIVVGEDMDVGDGPSIMRVPLKGFAPERFSNIAALGVVGALVGVDGGLLERTVVESFGKRGEKAAEENLRALRAGFEWCEAQGARFARLAAVSGAPRRLAMSGNEAIALGAMSAGLKFYSFYPMSPSTPIALVLSGEAGRMGLVVEQAEDEIAAINMAIGASFAGAPSMVATSGGGFALMVEGVSLAGMTETPLVVVVAQRPGPATGLPTRTEQADLEFVLHAGHGEFPRAIFAPGTVEECFHLTRRAFELAERYQGPMFVLTDQFLADSYRAVEPFDVGALASVRPGAGAVEGPYLRYAITESGVSPRLLPGMSEHLVVVDSDEHHETGHITEDLSVRGRMVEKRLRKGEGMRGEVVPPEAKGPEKPELLLVSWGSSKGAVEEAASRMRAEGRKVATLHFSQVWPLVGEQFMARLEEAGEAVCVEGNAVGQLARLIRRETGFVFHRRLSRYDGLPFTPEEILRQLKRS